MFSANKGQNLVMEVLARRLGSPLDSILTLLGPAGKKLQENDDANDPDPGDGLLTHQADSRLVYTFPAKGDYVLRLRDIQGKGGDAYAYRLIVGPQQPDFSLRVSPEHARAARGDNLFLTVQAIRKGGFSGPIELSVRGLPPGYQVTPTVIDSKQDRALLTIAIPEQASAAVAPVVVGSNSFLVREGCRPSVTGSPSPPANWLSPRSRRMEPASN